MNWFTSEVTKITEKISKLVSKATELTVEVNDVSENANLKLASRQFDDRQGAFYK